MISRLQNCIFRQFNVSCQRFLSNVYFDNDLPYLIDENFAIQEKDDKSQSATIKNEICKDHQNFTVDENGFVTVFTDGSCTFNGHEKARAGIGVWFGDNHPLNVSEPIVGRSTCNVAEIMAATKAVNVAKKAGVKKLKVFTDSNFLIKSVTEWMPKWKINGWKNATKKPVVNKQEFIALDKTLSSIEVSWAHVASHSGIHGNEMANILAKQGIDAAKE